MKTKPCSCFGTHSVTHPLAAHVPAQQPPRPWPRPRRAGRRPRPHPGAHDPRLCRPPRPGQHAPTPSHSGAPGPATLLPGPESPAHAHSPAAAPAARRPARLRCAARTPCPRAGAAPPAPRPQGPGPPALCPSREGSARTRAGASSQPMLPRRPPPARAARPVYLAAAAVTVPRSWRTRPPLPALGQRWRTGWHARLLRRPPQPPAARATPARHLPRPPAQPAARPALRAAAPGLRMHRDAPQPDASGDTGTSAAQARTAAPAEGGPGKQSIMPCQLSKPMHCKDCALLKFQGIIAARRTLMELLHVDVISRT